MQINNIIHSREPIPIDLVETVNAPKMESTLSKWSIKKKPGKNESK